MTASEDNLPVSRRIQLSFLLLAAYLLSCWAIIGLVVVTSGSAVLWPLIIVFGAPVVLPMQLVALLPPTAMGEQAFITLGFVLTGSLLGGGLYWSTSSSIRRTVKRFALFWGFFAAAGSFWIFKWGKGTPWTFTAGKANTVAKLLAQPGPENESRFHAKYDRLDDWKKSHVIEQCLQGACPEAETVKLFEDYMASAQNGTARFSLLYSVRTKTLIPQLERLLHDKDEGVRAQAACRLADLTGKIYEYDRGNFAKHLDSTCAPIQALRSKKV